MNMTKSHLRKALETLMRVNLRVCLVLLSLIVLPGCVHRREIRAAIWMHSMLPQELCEKYPVLKEYGVYRKLKDGRYEVLSYCHPEIQKFLGMHEKDAERLLNATLPQEGTRLVNEVEVMK